MQQYCNLKNLYFSVVKMFNQSHLIWIILSQIWSDLKYLRCWSESNPNLIASGQIHTTVCQRKNLKSLEEYLPLVKSLLHDQEIISNSLPKYFSFLDGKFGKAVELYSKAIEKNPFIAPYYGNRSICHIRLECFGLALSDANKCIELDRKYVKVCTIF